MVDQLARTSHHNSFGMLASVWVPIFRSPSLFHLCFNNPITAESGTLSKWDRFQYYERPKYLTWKWRRKDTKYKIVSKMRVYQTNAQEKKFYIMVRSVLEVFYSYRKLNWAKENGRLKIRLIKILEALLNRPIDLKSPILLPFFFLRNILRGSVAESESRIFQVFSPLYPLRIIFRQIFHLFSVASS